MKSKFINYSGAGLNQEERDNNTKHLAQLLKKSHILFDFDTDHAGELWGGTDLNLKIKKGANTIYVGYDRYGFCIDGADNLGIDQSSLQTTFNAIKNWYF